MKDVVHGDGLGKGKDVSLVYRGQWYTLMSCSVVSLCDNVRLRDCMGMSVRMLGMAFDMPLPEV
jgi:hypothetical protein